jgi:hypothetical protein
VGHYWHGGSRRVTAGHGGSRADSEDLVSHSGVPLSHGMSRVVVRPRSCAAAPAQSHGGGGGGVGGGVGEGSPGSGL